MTVQLAPQCAEPGVGFRIFTLSLSHPLTLSLSLTLSLAFAFSLFHTHTHTHTLTFTCGLGVKVLGRGVRDRGFDWGVGIRGKNSPRSAPASTYTGKPRPEPGVSQGQNLALTVLYVPYSLDTGNS
jgi:hypothetical protein